MNGSRARLAAIDVGSNTVLLTVAEYDPEAGLVVIEEGEDQPRLGAGLAATGRLSEEAMLRALRTLTSMRDICHRHNVRRVDAVATAAVREASNGAEFIERVGELDIPLRIISPETEAALSYRSAAHHFPGGGRQLVADIGGGSLELIGAANGRVTLSRSLPLGAVRLTELGLPLDQLRGHIRHEFAASMQPGVWAGSMVVGSGGTFATLASIVLARRASAGQSVHGLVVQAEEVEQLLVTLAGLPIKPRRQTPGLRPERADIIVAGLAVVGELLRVIEARGVTVSGFGLRDGLLLEMAGVE
ncbi:MAG TPA: Ppx/GppA phosphatase family protein [Gemmatimonadales bacterium]|nr:Ppx/GppA phosphatase family protein [Gemmatimonadales bacterium]